MTIPGADTRIPCVVCYAMLERAESNRLDSTNFSVHLLNDHVPEDVPTVTDNVKRH